MSGTSIIVAPGTGLGTYEAACRAVAEAKTIIQAKDIGDKATALRIYARQAGNRQLEIDALDIRVIAERKVGELLQVEKRNGGLNGGTLRRGSSAEPRDVRPALKDFGIGKKLSMRAQRLAKMPVVQFDEHRQSLRRRLDAPAARITLGTGDNEWWTPAEHVALARHVLGAIDLDPASCAQANLTVQAARFFDIHANGLLQPWTGRVFCNPPYAQPAIHHFVDKLVAEWQAGHVTAAIMLTHNFTDTRWFHALFDAAQAQCFTRGRIRFVAPDNSLSVPTNGQCFHYFGPDVERFTSIFSDVGAVKR